MASSDLEDLRATLTILYEDGYEAVVSLVHPEFEMETIPGLAAEPQVYRGRDGMRRWWESFYEVMDEIRFEPLRYHPGTDGRVVVEFRLLARGQSSGVEVKQEAVALVTMNDGMLRRFEFMSLDAALAAASSRSAPDA